jgi:hypothetical protein
MAALIDAATGYGTSADLSDATPQPDSADSLASLEVPSSYASFLWPIFAIIAAATGYETVADFFDTSPQPNFADSSESLGLYYNSIIEGRLILVTAGGIRSHL